MEYAVMDVETTMLTHGKRPETKFWGYADELGYKRFNSTNSFKRFLLRDLKPHYILHHSNFDIIQMLIDGAFKLQILRSHNGKLIMCKYGEHVLLNSYAMFPVSLEEIFKSYGKEKTSLDNLEKRNFDDCVAGRECLLSLDAAFETLCGQSVLRKHTIAGTAFAAAEAIAGKMPKDLRYLDAYRGAKTEVFDTNEVIADKYDINSSYPFALVQSPQSDELLLCNVSSDDYYCPFYDASEHTKLLFPSGRFSTYVFAGNLEAYYLPFKGSLTILSRETIDLSWLGRVGELAHKVFAKKQSCVKESGMYLCCKLFLNSLYGRIGLRGESERCRILNYVPDGDGLVASQLSNTRFIVWDKIVKETRSNYPMAAYITDNGRARLHRAFVDCSAIYGDTDSVVTVRDTKPSVMGKGLGEWKHEGKELFKADNLKDYRWADKHFQKGGGRKLQWTLKKATRGESAIEVDKVFCRELQKRILLSDGTTRPIEVNTI